MIFKEMLWISEDMGGMFCGCLFFDVEKFCVGLVKLY